MTDITTANTKAQKLREFQGPVLSRSMALQPPDVGRQETVQLYQAAYNTHWRKARVLKVHMAGKNAYKPLETRIVTHKNIFDLGRPTEEAGRSIPKS